MGSLMKCLASFRRARAVELALTGMPYDEIAAAVGYANRGTAWRTVQRALRDRTFKAVDEYREMELSRLDALQSACWEQALTGELRAVEAVLKVMHQRSRLLGLDNNMATMGGNQGLFMAPESLIGADVS
jgi:hypothetical protein